VLLVEERGQWNALMMGEECCVGMLDGSVL